MEKSTSHAQLRRAVTTRKPNAHRPSAGHRNPPLPEIAEEPFKITARHIFEMALIPAAMLSERSAENMLDEDLKRDPFRRRFADADFVIQTTLLLLLIGGGLCAGTMAWGVLKALSFVTNKLNRRKYLPRERERRRALARERRRLRRRTTLNAAPTPETLLEAWRHVRESPSNMIRFGSMLCDLEAYVDNSLIHDENGEICGRRPGIRGWLSDNCPVLSAKYKTVMGYKAMANKFRQAMGLADPYPAAMALDLVSEEDVCQNMVRRDKGETGDDAAAEAERAADAVQAAEMYRVTKASEGWGNTTRKNMVRRTTAFLKDCGRSRRSVLAAIEVRVHPDAIPRIVEIAERREQGLPDRDGPAMRLARLMA